jgi:alkylation response protein AidB-like acyl-CoA dehydrogenase
MNSPARRFRLSEAIADAAESRGREDEDLATEVSLLRSAGWLAACLPEDQGGEGWGTEHGGANPAFEALREVGRVDLSLARLFEGHMNAVKLVMLHGSSSLRSEVAHRVRGGALLGVWGADDPDHPVKAEAQDGKLILHGAKRYASGLGLVEGAIITASNHDGVQIMFVPTREPDRADGSSWRMSAMRATRSGIYDFEGITIPAGWMVGKPGDLLREPWFEGGIWRYCAAHLGAAETLHDEMCNALIARDRHGDANQRRRIAASAMAIETTRLWLERCASLLEAPGAAPELAALSLFAREVTENACREVMRLVEQSLGMAAFVEGTTLDRMRRDLSLFLCQARPDAKREAAVEILLEHGTRVDEL